MKHICTFDIFESLYDPDVPSWIRFERDSEPDYTRVHYGKYSAGDVNTERKFFEYLQRNNISYEKAGSNNLLIHNDIADRLRAIVKPGSRMNEGVQHYDTFYHGTPNGDLSRSPHEIHVGTYEAAKEALNARIGVPAKGDWDGTREYGKTLLAGKKTLRKKDPRGFLETGFNCGDDVPENDYLPADRKERADYSDRSFVDFKDKPNILEVRIIGPMTNTPYNPHSDTQANGLIRRSIKSGKAHSGFYYINDGEDSGSVSAVVPSKSHLEIV